MLYFPPTTSNGVPCHYIAGVSLIFPGFPDAAGLYVNVLLGGNVDELRIDLGVDVCVVSSFETKVS